MPIDLWSKVRRNKYFALHLYMLIQRSDGWKEGSIRGSHRACPVEIAIITLIRTLMMTLICAAIRVPVAVLLSYLWGSL